MSGPNTGPNPKPPLPPRAKAIFALAAILILMCLYARRPGLRLEPWQKWLLDAPMFVMVALSSLIWATYRHADKLDAGPKTIDPKANEERPPLCERTVAK